MTPTPAPNKDIGSLLSTMIKILTLNAVNNLNTSTSSITLKSLSVNTPLASTDPPPSEEPQLPPPRRNRVLSSLSDADPPRPNPLRPDPPRPSSPVEVEDWIRFGDWCCDIRRKDNNYDKYEYRNASRILFNTGLPISIVQQKKDHNIATMNWWNQLKIKPGIGLWYAHHASEFTRWNLLRRMANRRLEISLESSPEPAANQRQANHEGSSIKPPYLTPNPKHLL